MDIVVKYFHISIKENWWLRSWCQQDKQGRCRKAVGPDTVPGMEG